MTRAELVEKMARAIMCSRPSGGCIVQNWPTEARDNPHVATAIAQATAALAAIEAAGCVVVPREATREMLLAPLHVGRPWEERDPLGAMPGHRVMESRVDLRPTIYRAMCAASPLAKERGDHG
jgi:hypothetical protein